MGVLLRGIGEGEENGNWAMILKSFLGGVLVGEGEIGGLGAVSPFT